MFWILGFGSSICLQVINQQVSGTHFHHYRPAQEKYVLCCQYVVAQFNFSSQNLRIERNFFKWDGKETKILNLLFHRIWKKILFKLEKLFFENYYSNLGKTFFSRRQFHQSREFLVKLFCTISLKLTIKSFWVLK